MRVSLPQSEAAVAVEAVARLLTLLDPGLEQTPHRERAIRSDSHRSRRQSAAFAQFQQRSCTESVRPRLLLGNHLEGVDADAVWPTARCSGGFSGSSLARPRRPERDRPAASEQQGRGSAESRAWARHALLSALGYGLPSTSPRLRAETSS